jgi:hypothetical protein
MTATQIANLNLIRVVATAAASCASAPARFYNLDSTATPDGMPATRAAVMVGPVSVLAAFGTIARSLRPSCRATQTRRPAGGDRNCVQCAHSSVTPKAAPPYSAFVW